MSTGNQNFEEDTYSQIFATLKHPIRRGIIRMLADGPKSYTELLNALRIDSPRLNYHLQELGDIANKAEDGRYCLSTVGKATVRLIEGVEEPLHKFKSKLWKTFQLVGGILSILSLVLIPISQIRIGRAPYIIEHFPAHPRYGETYFYSLRWLELPAVIILAIGITLMICGYLVKRNYGSTS